MKLFFFGQSDKGRVRKANEDFFAHERVDDDEHLFVVADGMGGHQAGDVASRVGTETFVQSYKTQRVKKKSIIDSMQEAIKTANSTILKKASADPAKRGMGTTFSAMVLGAKHAHIVHVGDSRIYLVRNKEIKRITTDHTFVEKMMEEGRISEEEARNHPQKNILYMSLGARESFSPILIDNYPIKEDDIFVMCSDGLNNMVPDDTIREYSLSYKPKDMVEELINLANVKGGTDNITVQVIQVGGNEDRKKTEPIRIIKGKKSIFFSVAAILIILLTVILFIL